MAPPNKLTAPTPELLAEFKAMLGPDVEAQLVLGGAEGLNNRTLTRWLVARKMDMDKACKDLTAHAAWRAAHTGEFGYMPEETVAGELDQEKAFLAGVDRAGHPTLIARVHKHKIAKDHKDFYNAMIYTLDLGVMCGEMEERRTGKTWDGKLTGIMDLQGMGLSNCDSAGLLTIFNLLQNHYVERLHKMYLYCAPSIFYGVWAIVSPFVDPVTRKKVEFVSAKDAAKIFEVDYEPGVLPPELGGNAPDRPTRIARRELLAEQAAWKAKQPQGASAAAATAATEAVAEGVTLGNAVVEPVTA